jgi:integrase
VLDELGYRRKVDRDVAWLSVRRAAYDRSCLDAGTATHLRGVPLAVIAARFGHADASITARIYTHSQNEFLLAAAKTLGTVVTSS